VGIAEGRALYEQHEAERAADAARRRTALRCYCDKPLDTFDKWGTPRKADLQRVSSQRYAGPIAQHQPGHPPQVAGVIVAYSWVCRRCQAKPAAGAGRLQAEYDLARKEGRDVVFGVHLD
jgi:hypothetical protein